MTAINSAPAPQIILQPAQSTTVPVTNFVSTRPADIAAAPPAEPKYPAPVAPDSNSTSTINPNPSPSTDESQSSNPNPSDGPYTAVAAVNTPTIRGVNINIQA